MANFKFLTLILIMCGCGMVYRSSDFFKNEESQALFNIARKYQFKGDLDSALIYFNKADSAAPNTPLIIHERGLLKSSMRKYDEAILDLTKSIELADDERRKDVYLLNRGLVYMEMKQMTDACNDWKNARKRGKYYVKKYCQ